VDPSPTSYDKTFLNDGKGIFGFTGSSQVISSYYNNWLGVKSSCWVDGTSPTSIDYYKFVIMTIPSVGAPNDCGDFIGTRTTPIYLHPTSTVITGTTGISDYYMKITANTITNQYPIVYGSCDVNCESTLNSIVSRINNYSTGSTSNYGTKRDFSPTGVYYQNSMYINKFIAFNNNQTGYTSNGYFKSSTSIGNTYPFSGTPVNNPIPPYTIIPSLSGTVCDYNQFGTVTNYSSYQTFTYTKWYYQFRLPNPLNNNDFEIWATPIISGVVTPPQVLAYRYSGGNVTFSSSTYIIG
jgi:hypothetical protein